MSDFEKAEVKYRTPDCGNCGQILDFCVNCGRDYNLDNFGEEVYCDGFVHECPDCHEAESSSNTFANGEKK